MSNNTSFIKRTWNRILNTPEWQGEVTKREELRKRQAQEEARLKKKEHLKETVESANENIIIINNSLRKLKSRVSPLHEERNELLKKASESPLGRTKAAEFKFATISSLLKIYQQNIERLETTSVTFELIRLRAQTIMDIIDLIPHGEIDAFLKEAEDNAIELLSLNESLKMVDETIGTLDEDAIKLFRDHCATADAADAGGVKIDTPISDIAYDGGN